MIELLAMTVIAMAAVGIPVTIFAMLVEAWDRDGW